MTSFVDIFAKWGIQGERVVEPNSLYPDESYEQFISRMIAEKRKKLKGPLTCIECNDVFTKFKNEILIHAL